MKKNFYIFISSLFCLVFLNCIGQTNENQQKGAVSPENKLGSIKENDIKLGILDNKNLNVHPSDSLSPNIEKLVVKNIDEVTFGTSFSKYIIKEDILFQNINGIKQQIREINSYESVAFSKNRTYATVTTLNNEVPNYLPKKCKNLTLLTPDGFHIDFGEQALLWGEEGTPSKYIPTNDGKFILLVLEDPFTGLSIHIFEREKEKLIKTIELNIPSPISFFPLQSYFINEENQSIVIPFHVDSNQIKIQEFSFKGKRINEFSIDGNTLVSLDAYKENIALTVLDGRVKSYLFLKGDKVILPEAGLVNFLNSEYLSITKGLSVFICNLKGANKIVSAFSLRKDLNSSIVDVVLQENTSKLVFSLFCYDTKKKDENQNNQQAKSAFTQIISTNFDGKIESKSDNLSTENYLFFEDFGGNIIFSTNQEYKTISL